LQSALFLKGALAPRQELSVTVPRGLYRRFSGCTRCSYSHAQLRHPQRRGRVTVPLQAGETIGPGLLRAILAQAGITADELRSAL
jgi:hypothetical protein